MKNQRPMHINLSSAAFRRTTRRGFTLIEMLVSAALTVIIMLMFAQVYQVAGESVARQKGIAENDQRSRMLTTIINNDLKGRTFELVLPFHPLENPPFREDLRQGYFYISENDPQNDADDVLQFTVNVGETGTPLTGRATSIGPPVWSPTTVYALDAFVVPSTPDGFYYRCTAAGTSGGAEPAWPGVLTNTVADGTATWTCVNVELNEPDADDGQITFPTNIVRNGTGASPAAEVSYFLRNGNLYRRVLLIRDSYASQTAPAQPPAIPFASVNALYPDFWNDFDYSAFHDAAIPGPRFHEYPADLSNIGATLNSLGRPFTRFGHYHVNPSQPIGAGNPREYTTINQWAAGTLVPQGSFVLPTAANGYYYRCFVAGTTDPGVEPPWPVVPGATVLDGSVTWQCVGLDPGVFFLGRFTQQETSDADFGYPGQLNFPGPTSPMDRTVALGFGDGVVPGFADGTRRGEDILMTNVHAFDVKIFDDNYSELGGFDVNHNGQLDDPATGGAFADIGHNARGGDFQISQSRHNNVISYGPVQFDLVDAQPGTATVDDDLNGTADDATEIGWPQTNDNVNRIFDTWHHQLNIDRSNEDADGDPETGLATMDPPPFWPRPNGTTVWTAGGAYNVGDVVVPPFANETTLHYRCTVAGTAGGAQPAWTNAEGTTVGDGTVTWTCAAARLRAIQITIRFYDPSSNQMRQLTLVQSLISDN